MHHDPIPYCHYRTDSLFLERASRTKARHTGRPMTTVDSPTPASAPFTQLVQTVSRPYQPSYVYHAPGFFTSGRLCSLKNFVAAKPVTLGTSCPTGQMTDTNGACFADLK